ncbi:lipocalin family protein [Flavobacterium psychrophilum]|nr:lipocalin family protein [Flavobacterium psychrophilum]
MLILLLSFTTLSSISCSKEDKSTPVVETNSAKIEGKWYYTKQGRIENGQEILQDFTDNQAGCSKNYRIFNTDGTGSDVTFKSNCEINSTENYTWTKNTNTLTIGGSLVSEIIQLTDIELKVKFTKNNLIYLVVFTRA